MATDEQLNGRVTLRDLARVEAGQEKILAEISKLQARVDAKFESHQTKHEAEQAAHDTEHRREGDRRAGLIRWAVTAVLSGMGALIALYVAFKGP